MSRTYFAAWLKWIYDPMQFFFYKRNFVTISYCFVAPNIPVKKDKFGGSFLGQTSWEPLSAKAIFPTVTKHFSL